MYLLKILLRITKNCPSYLKRKHTLTVVWTGYDTTSGNTLALCSEDGILYSETKTSKKSSAYLFLLLVLAGFLPCYILLFQISITTCQILWSTLIHSWSILQPLRERQYINAKYFKSMQQAGKSSPNKTPIQSCGNTDKKDQNGTSFTKARGLLSCMFLLSQPGESDSVYIIWLCYIPSGSKI